VNKSVNKSVNEGVNESANVNLDANATAAPLTLRAESLTLIRGERTLFEDLSFQINAGEALILRGVNGVGKTSLLRVLAGFTIADGGQVTFYNKKQVPLGAIERALTRYVSHANQLKDGLSAEENLHEALLLDAIASTHQSRLDALNKVGLLAQRSIVAKKLSQGQKRRVGIASLILCRKPIWLLDEPTNALDDAGATLLLKAVDQHLTDGGIAIVATHLSLALAQTSRTRELLMHEITLKTRH